MRSAYAHEAILDLAADGDRQAPGAAITVELCGHWEHEPPCPLAPHHTTVQPDGPRLLVRTLFAADPDVVPVVRERIDRALSRGELTGPDGVTTRWRMTGSWAVAVTAGEADHAARLVAG